MTPGTSRNRSEQSLSLSRSSATSRTRGKAAVGTVGIIDATQPASSSDSRSGPPATAAPTTGPGSSPATSTAPPRSRTSTSVSFGSTPGISPVIAGSSKTLYKPITAISLRGGGVANAGQTRRSRRAAPRPPRICVTVPLLRESCCRVLLGRRLLHELHHCELNCARRPLRGAARRN